MCLILFLYDDHPDYRIILCSNRDEYYDRPTRHLNFWNDNPNILAGRDLQSNGTWLGITKNGRFAAITNYRNPKQVKACAPSRGLLVSNYLSGDDSCMNYLKQVEANGNKYNGFNLLVGDTNRLLYYSNKKTGIQTISKGIKGLSNHFLDTPWPKVEKGKKDFEKTVFEKKGFNLEDLFNVLNDRYSPPDDRLPKTGVGVFLERILSPIFVSSKNYGTSSSSILLINKKNRVTFAERTYTRNDKGNYHHNTKIYSFNIT